MMYQIYSYCGRWIAQTVNLNNGMLIAQRVGGWVEDEDNPGIILYDYR